MKNIISLTLFIFATLYVFAQQKIDSKIEHVTVFLSGAQVQRSASAFAPNGKSDIIFKGLTPNLDVNSLVVSGEGDFTIMSVKHAMNFLEEKKRTDTIVNLEKQRDDLTEKRARLGLEKAVIENEIEILRNNNRQVVGISNTTLSTKDVKELMDLQSKSLTENYNKKFDIENNTEKIKLEQNKISNQLNDLNARKNTATAEVIVTVFNKTSASVSAKLKLEYIVPNTSWYTEYDLRVKDLTAPVLTQMKAKVRQNSGEDWNNVQLTLSTGEPQRSGIKPELGTWYLHRNGNSDYTGRNMSVLDEYQNKKLSLISDKIQGIITDAETKEPLIGASVIIKGTLRGAQTDVDGKYSVPIQANENNIELVVSYAGYETQTIKVGNNRNANASLKSTMVLQEVVVTGYGGTLKKKNESSAASSITIGDVSQSYSPSKKSDFVINFPDDVTVDTYKGVNQNIKPTTTSFDIELPYTIPTDNKENAVEIKEVTMPAFYKYSSAPQLDVDAFLAAYILNWEQYNLIEGEANLYFEGTYLGKTLIGANTTDDTLKISLGRDKSVVIKRTKLKEFSKGTFLSDKKIDARSYEIAVKNKKSVPISIDIEDQIPVSTDKSIEVEFEARGAEFDKVKGRLTWKLDLKPNEDRKLNFKFTVKHPSSVRFQLD